jgi:carboxypeptidase PM20D1
LLLPFLMVASIHFPSYAYSPDSTQIEIGEAAMLLSQYLQIPSISGNELKAGQFLAGVCAANGLIVEYFTVEKDSYNFAASLYPLSLGKPNIILINHIDVVPEGDTTMWTYPPYSGTIADGHVWGRGAIDAKGLGIMQLMAMLPLKEAADTTDLPFNVTLLSVSGEEVGGQNGAGIVVQNFLEYLNPVVVFGEGGSGLKEVLTKRPQTAFYGISVAEKRPLWIQLELQHVTFGHGATPAPAYANKSMIEALTRINTRKLRLEFDKSNRLMFRELGKAIGGINGFFVRRINWVVFSPFVKSYLKKNPLYKALVTNTITITNLYNPPGPPNKIASTASAILDCRILPGTSEKAFLRYLTNLIDDPNIEIKVLNKNSTSGGFSKPNVFYDAMEEAILRHDPTAEVVPLLFPASTDNSYFRHYDIPTYGIIPALITQEMVANIHSIDEKISIEALEQGVAIYTAFLMKAMEMDERTYEKLLADL